MNKKEMAAKIDALEVKVSILENHVEVLRDLVAPQRPRKTHKPSVTSGPNLASDWVEIQ